MKLTQSDKVKKLIQEKGILRPRDLDSYRIPRMVLRRMEEKGILTKISRGIYTLPGTEYSEHHSIAAACKKVPQGVICLISALVFHKLTTQAPFQVWMAIGEKDHKPQVDYPPIRFFRYSKEAFSKGISEKLIDNVHVQIYNPAKTVADCFKYRNKIGKDVAIEALRDCLEQKLCTYDELWKYAEICRVSNVMRPYLEAMP
jgi:predicted transcriptional regulator of viral defense system